MMIDRTQPPAQTAQDGAPTAPAGRYLGRNDDAPRHPGRIKANRPRQWQYIAAWRSGQDRSFLAGRVGCSRFRAALESAASGPLRNRRGSGDAGHARYCIVAISARLVVVPCWRLPRSRRRSLRPRAQQDFYAGKQITFIVGAGVGGGYDLQARTAARHLGRHIPGNPTVVVQNMPAAGSIAATNFMFSTAPKDGTTIALIQRGMLLSKLTYPAGTRFELEKFGWVGSLNSETAVTLSWNATSPHRTAKDLFERGADRRRHRERRSRDHAAALQFADRNQVQDRVGLQQHRADRARDRARRGAGHRRLVVVELQGGAAELDPRQARSRC